MSCMYLSKNHYQFIADSLYRIGSEFRGSARFLDVRNWLGDTAKEREEKILYFVSTLQGWNHRAYFERYPNQEDDAGPELVTTINPVGGNVDVCQLLKALECADYQCADAAEYPGSSTESKLERIAEDCRRHIVEDVQAYKDAKWGIGD